MNKIRHDDRDLAGADGREATCGNVVFIKSSVVLFLIDLHRGTAENPARHNAESWFAASNR